MTKHTEESKATASKDLGQKLFPIVRQTSKGDPIPAGLQHELGKILEAFTFVGNILEAEGREILAQSDAPYEKEIEAERTILIGEWLVSEYFDDFAEKAIADYNRERARDR